MSLLPEYDTGTLATPDGARKAYVRVGEGPNPIVVVPGAGDGFRTPADVAVYVAWFYRQRCEDYRLLILSRRDPIPAGYTIVQHAADMIRTVEELDWGPAFWECLSAGGPIGQWVAAHRPDLVRGLILSSALHHATGRTRTILEQWVTMAAEPDGGAALFSMIEQKYRPPADVLSSEQLAETEAVPGREYPHRLRHMLQGVLDLDHRELLASIACPTLVISGEDDRFVPVELQRDMATRIPDARQVICDDYGHFHDLENPAYHALVDEFVQSLRLAEPLAAR